MELTRESFEAALLNAKPFLTQRDLSELFNVKPASITNWWRAGHIPPPIRIGRRLLRWRTDELLKWLDAGAPNVNETREGVPA